MIILLREFIRMDLKMSRFFKGFSNLIRFFKREKIWQHYQKNALLLVYDKIIIPLTLVIDHAPATVIKHFSNSILLNQHIQSFH